jgi:hypothetical protein
MVDLGTGRGNGPSDSIRDRIFGQMSDCQFIKFLRYELN